MQVGDLVTWRKECEMPEEAGIVQDLGQGSVVVVWTNRTPRAEWCDIADLEVLSGAV